MKTRLGLPGGIAAELHTAFVRDTLEMASALGHPLELHTDQPCAAWPEFGGPRRLQVEGDLGARMLAAFARGPALILGGDAPGLPASHAASLLERPEDVAIGPAEDGGYWGILCRRPRPEMFAGVEWSTERALAQTAASARAAGLSVGFGERWFDVDDRASLRRLFDSPPRHTAEFLSRRQDVLHLLSDAHHAEAGRSGA